MESARPVVAAFDALGTLLSLAPVEAELKALLPEPLAASWFPALWRDAFALQLADRFRGLLEVARAELERLRLSPAEVRRVLGAFAELPAQPEAERALGRLRDAGARAVVLSDAGAAATARLLKASRLDGLVDRTISIEDAGQWKPGPGLYRTAARLCRVAPEEAAFLGARPWDVQGAKSAGLSAAWVDRAGEPYPAVMDPPDVVAPDLDGAVDGLLSLPLRARTPHWRRLGTMGRRVLALGRRRHTAFL